MGIVEKKRESGNDYSMYGLSKYVHIVLLKRKMETTMLCRV